MKNQKNFLLLLKKFYVAEEAADHKLKTESSDKNFTLKVGIYRQLVLLFVVSTAKKMKKMKWSDGHRK